MTPHDMNVNNNIIQLKTQRKQKWRFSSRFIRLPTL